MKRLMTLLLAAVLAAALCACGGPTSALPSPTPSVSPSAAPSDSPAPDDGARYFFASGLFLGSWDGQWHSAADGGFSLSSVFCRPYIGVMGPVGAVRFFAGNGPGEFYDPEKVAAALEPNGIFEGENFIMKLPATLTPAAAVVPVPDYGFYALFDGQTYQLISNAELDSLALPAAETYLPDGEVLQSLERAGIHCDLARTERSGWLCDVDGDGTPEQLELIQSPLSDNGYAALNPGDSIFYHLLLSDGDQLSVVASHHIDYTEEVTLHFQANLQSVCDLDGDGQCEIILQEWDWEWGHIAAFSQEEGGWAEVLRGEYGM